LEGCPIFRASTSSLNSAVLRVNSAISNTRVSNLTLIFPVATQPGAKPAARGRDRTGQGHGGQQVALTLGSIGVARVSRYLRDSTHLDCVGYSFGECRYHSG
jgi:hypothetical protein